MFEKFTDRARKAMSFARKSAQRLKSEFIGTEHILLGILEEGGGTACAFLLSRGVDAEKVMAEVAKLITPTEPLSIQGQLPYSPRSKRVLELADETAAQLHQEIIGTEHLLVALVKESEGIAAAVLKALGVGPDQITKLKNAMQVPATPHDHVNHPPHYGGPDNPYEAIKVIEAWGLGFCLGNTIKYIARAGKKDDLLQDLKKAAWYLNRQIEFMEKNK